MKKLLAFSVPEVRSLQDFMMRAVHLAAKVSIGTCLRAWLLACLRTL